MSSAGYLWSLSGVVSFLASSQFRHSRMSESNSNSSAGDLERRLLMEEIAKSYETFKLMSRFEVPE